MFDHGFTNDYVAHRPRRLGLGPAPKITNILFSGRQWANNRPEYLSYTQIKTAKADTSYPMPLRTIPIFNLFVGLMLLQPTAIVAVDQDSSITIGKQKISISYPETFSPPERQLTHRWIQTVTEALLTVYGELPKDSFNITIERSTRGSGPVPWGQVKRHSPTEVLLVINPEYGYDGLLADWTAFHELSHLLIPYQGYDDVWLSEGLATYYQNLIQARSGRFDEKEMWRRILAGFERGQRQTQWDQLSLTQVSNQMRQTRQFMRIHWSGVLYWMTADVELRKSKQTSLDQALKQLKACCMEEELSAREIAYRLDTLTGMRLFVPLFKQFSESHHMPAYIALMDQLGVQLQSGNIRFDERAPLAAIRKQLTAK